MTFFGLCCKDWGTRGDLRFVPVTHIQVSNPGNQIELSGRKLVIDSRSHSVILNPKLKKKTIRSTLFFEGCLRHIFALGVSSGSTCQENGQDQLSFSSSAVL
ncbi:hypothetical protein JHK86_049963 [Glycine max]|nr:hypothetical protein JHK86_049963 [Glycine max]